MEYKITIHDESETIELAENFESEKFPNMVICLNGDLGSGKTVFAKGFANALGIEEQVTSPTFNIVKEYYTEQLLERGWIKGKNAKGEDFYFHTDRCDEFRFYKDGYTLDLSFDIPLDQDPDKLIWGDTRRRYMITMAKTEFY